MLMKISLESENSKHNTILHYGPCVAIRPTQLKLSKVCNLAKKMHENSEYDMQNMLCARCHRDFVLFQRNYGPQLCLAILLVLLESKNTMSNLGGTRRFFIDKRK